LLRFYTRCGGKKSRRASTLLGRFFIRFSKVYNPCEEGASRFCSDFTYHLSLPPHPFSRQFHPRHPIPPHPYSTTPHSKHEMMTIPPSKREPETEEFLPTRLVFLFSSTIFTITCRLITRFIHRRNGHIPAVPL
jgi:hypothetical protein